MRHNQCDPRFLLERKYDSMENAVEAALRMEEDGADMIDVGGESTRPGSILYRWKEIRRVVPLVRASRENGTSHIG